MATSGLSFFSSFLSLQNRLWLFLLCAIAMCSSPVRSVAQESPHSSGWVVIPIDEYRDLHARAYPAEHEAEPPSVDATLTRVDYDLRSNDEIATGRAELTVDVLKDGWVRIPIPPGLLVREAQLDGKSLGLVSGGSGKGGGQVSALLSHPGRAVLVLSIALPVTATAGEESISLPPTQSGMTRASLQLGRPDVDVKVGGGLLTEKSEANRESKWMAYGRGTEPLTFSWRRKTEDHHSSLPLRMRGSLTELVSLGEDSTAMVAEAEVQVTQGEARAVKIHLPASININQVSGAAVADWEMQGGDLVVSFLEPVAQSTRFVVSGETRLARDGQVEIPLFRLLDAERETGGVAVEVLGAGEIKDPKSQGLEDADATDLGEMVTSRQSPSLAAFRFRNGDPATRALTLNIVRYTQQAVLLANVEEARYRVLLSNDGKSLVQARYAVRNNQRNFVKITLPAGATVWSAALSGKPVKPGQAPDGSLLVPLEKARGGEEAPEFVVEIVYFTRGVKWEDKGNFAVTLPALDLPVSRTGLLVYYPPLFKVSAEPGIFRTETYENPSSVAFNLNIEVGTGSGIGGVGVNAEELDQKQKTADRDTKALADKFFAKSQGARAKGILPIKVSFPAFGPSLFLVAELTSASQVPTSSLSYQRGKKGGAR
jgi:hypothetical protein